ncbi:hypothetical protein AS030_20530 [Fictibacillus enclensis]|uniref:Uncharacterized protein n=1 Tax=Fictibacillus enclensis TaxID=1017270 RepID=A0A0V8IZY8_9BACL|nr:hypothetical protein AS030_20530 [Fictibacillus enclensis]
MERKQPLCVFLAEWPFFLYRLIALQHVFYEFFNGGTHEFLFPVYDSNFFQRNGRNDGDLACFPGVNGVQIGLGQNGDALFNMVI